MCCVSLSQRVDECVTVRVNRGLKGGKECLKTAFELQLGVQYTCAHTHTPVSRGRVRTELYSVCVLY